MLLAPKLTSIDPTGGFLRGRAHPGAALHFSTTDLVFDSRAFSVQLVGSLQSRCAVSGFVFLMAPSTSYIDGPQRLIKLLFDSHAFCGCMIPQPRHL